jgi:hypothetical protein
MLVRVLIKTIILMKFCKKCNKIYHRMYVKIRIKKLTTVNKNIIKFKKPSYKIKICLLIAPKSLSIINWVKKANFKM